MGLKPILRNTTSFSALTLLVGSFDRKNVPEMTYNVFSGTLNPTHFTSLPIVDMCLRCEDTARQSCAMVLRWRFLATFLRPVFSASRVQDISDLHSKFALRPHHVWKYGRHPVSDC